MSRVRQGSFLAILVCLFAGMPAGLAAQGVVTGVVRSAEGHSLANALVSLSAQGRETFTDSAGVFRIATVSRDSVLLRVRRLGYVPVDTILTGSATAARASAIIVRERPRCTSPGLAARTSDSTLVALSQLLMNAEQLRVLSEKYPFEARMEVARAVKDVGVDAVRLVGKKEVVTVRSKSKWRYRPGTVVTGRRRYVFNIPTLEDLADDRFLESHCFYYAGADTAGGRATLRIDFVVADRITAPDVNGSLHMDPESFQIRRSVLRLSKMPGIRALTAYEVVGHFSEVMESIPIVHHIFARQTFDTTASRDQDYVFEEWSLVNFKFNDRKPGAPPPQF